MRQHRIRSLLVCSTSALLMACGGGGDSTPGVTVPTGSPASPVSPDNTNVASVTEVAQAMGLTGEGVATQGTTLDLQVLPLDLIAGTRSTSNNREQPLAISILANTNVSIDTIVYTTSATTYPCTVMLDEGCRGDLTIEASYPRGATSVPGGSYIAHTFNDLQGTQAGQQISLNGATRTDFLSDIDFTQRPANVRIQITNTGFSSTIDGVSFGPHTGVALLEFDASGALTYTVDQVSYSGMRDIVVTDRDNFSVGAATVRRPHWNDANTYVVYVYQNWNVVAGRPAVASTVTISTEGVAGNHVVTVATSSLTQVTYTVRSTVNGVVKNHLVTVDYAPGAEPVWSTVEVAG